MKCVVIRSKKSSVSVDNKEVSSIDKGLVILVGFGKNDTIDNINMMINKIINLRIFEDEFGKMNKSILDIKGSILSVSQFTLYANVKKGNRPSFIDAMNYDDAFILYNKFNELLSKHVCVKTGIYGSDMLVNIQNDGPITINLEF